MKISIPIKQEDRKSPLLSGLKIELGLSRVEFEAVLDSGLGDGNGRVNYGYYFKQYESKQARYRDFLEKAKSFEHELAELQTKYGLEISYFMEGDTHGIYESGMEVGSSEFTYLLGGKRDIRISKKRLTTTRKRDTITIQT